MLQVTPRILMPETTSIILTSNVKYNENATTKSAILYYKCHNNIRNYSTNNLQKFEFSFRYSQLIQDIDDTDTSILSNITTVKIKKRFYTYN